MAIATGLAIYHKNDEENHESNNSDNNNSNNNNGDSLHGSNTKNDLKLLCVYILCSLLASSKITC